MKTKRGVESKMVKLIFYAKSSNFEIRLNAEIGKWLLTVLYTTKIELGTPRSVHDLKVDFEKNFDDFELFWFSKPIQILRKNGLFTL